MFFFLSKILQFLISPVSWVFIILLWGILSKNPKRKKRLLITSLLVFYFFSNSFIVDEVFRRYEERDLKYSEITETYDVAIVLGGFVTDDPNQELEGFHSSSDRLFHALKLYKTGIAKKIMIVSGSGVITNQEEKEALVIKNYLLKIGIPKADLLVESESKNTHENAVNTALILNEKYIDGKYILVTSGFHMPRAKKCFEKAGLSITPFSVDQQAGERKFLIDHLFIPDTYALLKWEILLHEWTGFIAYKMAGYI
ncbi:MAG: hypothetical protein COX70_02545 [Flavobacteriales bacterium CG_4_10_14_0_2_um_filter_32_8]|nr:MAG: hypothetical protein COX70_02545 [Flavobacteriales bacterium CG_4_10_14_0_2_um_filter_32_8]